MRFPQLSPHRIEFCLGSRKLPVGGNEVPHSNFVLAAITDHGLVGSILMSSLGWLDCGVFLYGDLAMNHELAG